MTDLDDRDMLAAEYVLGTLDGAERSAFAARLGADPELARAVLAWEDRLSPLIAGVPEVAPPADAYDGIAARLFAGRGRGRARDGAVVAVLRRRLRIWQAATAGFALLAASLSAWVALRETAAPSAASTFTAVLQRDAGAPAMVVEVDAAARRLTVRPLDAAAPAGQVYQLWIIDPTLSTPRSLGVLPAHADVERSLSAYDPAVISAATYAVTVEPPGGSPTGRPSAAPVLSGKLSGR